MTFDELKQKYPDIHHAPRENCKFCRGTGEKITHLAGGKFIAEQDLTTPCICTFVDHELVDEVQEMLNQTIKNIMKGGA